MHRIVILVTSMAVLGGAQVADAGIVSIFVNDQSGWQLIAADNTGVDANTSSYTTPNGGFTLRKVDASMINGGSSANLNSSTFQIQHNHVGAEILKIAVIGTNFTGLTTAPIDMTSQVSGINQQGILTSLTFQSFVDSTNNGDPNFLSGGQGLQSPSVLPTIGGAGASLDATINSNLSSPYSVAHFSTLTMTGTGLLVSLGGNTLLTPQSPTPEPSSMALACAGLAGIGVYSWRRKQRAAVAHMDA
jgi:hypothetical protein